MAFVFFETIGYYFGGLVLGRLLKGRDAMTMIRFHSVSQVASIVELLGRLRKKVVERRPRKRQPLRRRSMRNRRKDHPRAGS